VSALRLRGIVQRARGSRPVLRSGEIAGPLVAGWLCPAILLPESSENWTLARRRAVIAHEAAHVRRRDPVILFAAHIATAVYWFHPLCWLALARLRRESERACDNAALRIGRPASDYAGHLLDLARRFDTQLAIPMATTKHLESRVKSILDPKISRSLCGPVTWAATLMLTAALVAPLATFTLRAQQAGANASISGTVYDPSGARVPAAKLTATNSDGGYRTQTVADPVGMYSFSNLPAGHYTVEAEVPGFVPFRVNDLVLVTGGHIQVDANLAVGGLVMRETVSAENSPNAPKTASAAPQRIRIGGNIQPSVLIFKVDPEYPADLRARGIEGTVYLDAVLSKNGVPLSMKLQNPGVNQEFVDAAKAAFAQWRFRPTLLNGEPVEVSTTIQIDFKLTTFNEPKIDDRIR
jgi:TonB family protein